MAKNPKTKAPKTDPAVDYPESDYQPLPNKEAIVAFNGKALLTSESYLDVKAYQHALAFTVAGLMDEDLLAETRDAIASALENGTDFRTFKQRLKPYLVSKGWLSEMLDDGTQKLEVGSNRRLRTIYSTNLQSAYSAGQWSRIQQTKEFLPYLQYMPSVSENPRLSHKKYYGLCRPADDPIWQSIMPSNGWGCKCWVKQLTKRQAQKVGISDDKPLETESYTNPRTGEKSQIPVGIDPSFAHNHDPITAVLRLAEDRHGKAFANKLKKQAEKLLPDNLPIVPVIPMASGTNLLTDWVGKSVSGEYQADFNDTYADIVKELDLSLNEFIALKYYTGNGYETLNQYLRGELSNLPDKKITILENAKKMVNQALEKMPIHQGQVTRRLELTPEQLAEYIIGETKTFAAFTSASYAKDVIIAGRGNVRLIITSETGRYVDKLSDHAHETEVLFKASKEFLVLDIRPMDNYTEIELMEI